MHTSEEHQVRLSQLTELLHQGDLNAVRLVFSECHAAEIAHLLESLPPDERHLAWELVDHHLDGDVLLHVNDEVRSGLIRNMDQHELVAATEGLDADDLADIIPDLPENVIDEVLKAMDEQNRHRLESILKFPEDTAGGLMNVDAITVRPEVSLEVVQRYLKIHETMPEMTDNLYVVDRDDRYLGALPLIDILVRDGKLKVEEVMDPSYVSIDVTMPAHDVAVLFERRNLITAPVLDAQQRLMGRVTIDDVVDVIRDEADHSFMSRAGLDEEDDMFAPVVRSTRRRSVWLGINLLTALLASWVIGLFDATIEKLVALAVLMPVVASMGGIAGSQTLTIVVRGIALGQVVDNNAKQLLRKELAVGGLNGVIWAVVIAFVAYYWFDSVTLGVVIGLAILFNLIVAAFAGATIPLLLRRFGADPALAGGVVLTTVTDVVGFFTFLGMAALFLV
ncbi:MAG: magnesium transporter [Gammaproteobacteria bacterium]|nr:magnesium transporter [Gammaproteobacteria bacterium]